MYGPPLEYLLYRSSDPREMLADGNLLYDRICHLPGRFFLLVYGLLNTYCTDSGDPYRHASSAVNLSLHMRSWLGYNVVFRW